MKRPRSPYEPRRSQYVAAGIVGVVGLAVAALIAVLAIRASGNVPAPPGSYMIRFAPPAASAGR
ncbi:hypothetical protein E1281_39780 [Actinomadura sp. KC345]|uniref:hypothetical protein n=1 Tax=Actinomadura sp. KC345 TaxID=2530371 RepID=UPI001053709B|nr:hypothetical protein [Actinomadura sp. KC345]TDC36496.1 hypothetical protein E1281_39780 [Actinomadura sp. KC345]